MKGRESGMPSETYWETFFNVEATLDILTGPSIAGNVLEFGCGYGSFTLPVARRTIGYVTALDIDPEMVDCVQRKLAVDHISNVLTDVRDFVALGSGVATGSQSHAMIYNLLHLDHPIMLLYEAYRSLQDGGLLSIIHWRSDIPTPRGPSLAIRPTPEQCKVWMAEAGFRQIESINLQTCCPFHFGLLGRR